MAPINWIVVYTPHRAHAEEQDAADGEGGVGKFGRRGLQGMPYRADAGLWYAPHGSQYGSQREAEHNHPRHS
ncbi:hypothetical protein GCM10010277_08740 [Streptomyces longisporoflavus]|nr:hypothetical protein GCM10010277_08740 [Streptomyces longisporoflavus]